MNMQVDRSEIETKRGMSKKTLNRAWLITGLLILFQMINFADKAVLGLVAESVMSELGMTSTQFGFIGESSFPSILIGRPSLCFTTTLIAVPLFTKVLA